MRPAPLEQAGSLHALPTREQAPTLFPGSWEGVSKPSPLFQFRVPQSPVHELVGRPLQSEALCRLVQGEVARDGLHVLLLRTGHTQRTGKMRLERLRDGLWKMSSRWVQGRPGWANHRVWAWGPGGSRGVMCHLQLWAPPSPAWLGPPPLPREPLGSQMCPWCSPSLLAAIPAPGRPGLSGPEPMPSWLVTAQGWA